MYFLYMYYYLLKNIIVNIINKILIKSAINYINIRNIVISNIFVKIYAFEYNNKLYYVRYIYFIPFNLFKWILFKFNINIIYMYDNIIFISYNNIQIIPPIFLFELHFNKTIIDITNTIINYNSNIPLEFIINKELIKNSINEYNKILIKIKFFSNSKIIDKTIITYKSNILNKELLLYKIFNITKQ